MADEYISRDAAELLMCYACGFDCKRYKRVSGQSLITADDCYHLRDLYAIPAADVAEVVRCKDCGNNYGTREAPLCNYYPHPLTPNSYCFSGFRKTDESEDENG